VTVYGHEGTRDEVADWSARLGRQLRAQGLRPEDSTVTWLPARPGEVKVRVAVPGVVDTVAVRDPGLARPGQRPTLAQRMPMWSRWAVASTVVAVPLGVLAVVAYEVWVHRYVILGVLVVAVLLALLATRGRRVIALFEGGGVRWFDER
jgi:hypothetical protein